MCRIALLEGHALFCSVIKPILEKNDSLEVVTEQKHISSLLPVLKSINPDVLVIDIIHCGDNGITFIKKVKRRRSKLPILVVVSKDFSKYFEDYPLGVNGLVFNDSNAGELIQVVESLYNGEDYFSSRVWLLLKNHLRTTTKSSKHEKDTESQLTNREISILRLFCKGYTYKEIRSTLNISPRTVETHKKNITSKIKVRSTAEMVEFAIQNNLN